ncbi:MAG: NAD-dependent epimerase/dehydratase family protein [Deltaproteobacteria bacterium]|nr:NAD-dependent epimerase/dehydratase family protein [Deltaproteobacteria bacterium]
MRILILGGDGYLGWPTAMYLSRRGHEVAVVDNYFRRRACIELNREPLIALPNLNRRATLWERVSGHRLTVHIGDVCDYPFLLQVFREFEPDAVVHYAEQPAAPYSMMGHRQAVFTLTNNLVSTTNLIFAVKECNPACHIVKLGTMGVYGTPNIDIEEGYLEVEHKGRRHRFLYPKTPGSLYHLTKAQDGDLLYFYCRMWPIRVTDLNQGPVYGLTTGESAEDERLLPMFNYDDVFGTVLNRFLVQAVAGVPLTVYGQGGQTRGYLNIQDTLACVELALLHPPAPGEYQVFNQFVETFSVNDLARKVQDAGRALDLRVEVQHLPNPRREAEEHYYNPAQTGLLSLGLKPHYLDEATLCRMVQLVQKYRDQIQPELIFPQVRW